MGNKKKKIRLKAEFIRENPKSVYLECLGVPKWFPKDQVSYDSDTQYVTMSLWTFEKVFNRVLPAGFAQE